jgi:hypothetical protein
VRAFTNVWDTMNGMGDWKAKTGWGLLFYYVLTVFVNIGMLNIVISVVSDIYEKVMTTKHQSQLKIKAELLYDYATFRSLFTCCIDKDEELKHMYIIRLKKDADGEEEWTGRINATNVKIEAIKTDCMGKLGETET